MRRSCAVVCVVVAILANQLARSPGQADAALGASSVFYAPPVDAPVGDPFRAPAGPYAPGNRGLEYVTAAGQIVLAAGDGTVEFAGQVALANHVVIRHADGLRTGYSFLATTSVTKGQAVRRGAIVGTAGRLMHFGVRTTTGTYLDPMTLFGHVEVSARLTKAEAITPVEVHNERELAAMIFARAWVAMASGGDVFDAIDRVAVAVSSGLAWLTNVGLSYVTSVVDRLRLVAEFVGTIARLHVELVTHLVSNFASWLTRPCTEPSVALTPVGDPSHRVVILVGGLTTNTLANGTLDSGLENLNLTRMGYDPQRVVRFSYRGGRTPASTAAAFSAIPASTYTSADTEQSAQISSDRLADLVRQVRAADPTALIDIMGHSLGGLITENVATRPDVGALAHVVLFGAPVHGAELAGISVAINDNPVGGAGVDQIADHTGLPHVSSAVIRDLVPESSFISSLEWAIASPQNPHPPTVSIASASDAVVPAYRSHVDGARNVIEPLLSMSAHGELPGTSEALIETSRALNEQPASCQSFSQAVVVDTFTPVLVGGTENVVGVAVAAP